MISLFTLELSKQLSLSQSFSIFLLVCGSFDFEQKSGTVGKCPCQLIKFFDLLRRKLCTAEFKLYIV